MRIPNCIRVKDWSKVTFSMSFISEGQQEEALLSVGSHGIRSCIRITRPNRRGVGYLTGKSGAGAFPMPGMSAQNADGGGCHS